VSRHGSWRDADLVALDLEGSGAQDREAEVILEIATVPIVAGVPVVADAYCTLVNPGRTIAARPWISPGLTNAALAGAPDLTTVEPHLAARINGRVLVGHNISVDWRLLHRRCPTVAPSGLLDTYKLARHVRAGSSKALGALVEQQGLARAVTAQAAGSQPHRALWDTVAAALLLAALVEQLGRPYPSIGELLVIAGVPMNGARTNGARQPSHRCCSTCSPRHERSRVVGNEIEIKYRVLDREALTRALARIGVKLTPPVRQEDQAYAPASWRAGDSRIGVTFARLRTQGDGCTFTTKTPVDNVLACREHETSVGDRDQMHEAIQAMGYRPTVRIIKDRRTGVLSDFSICLDEVEGLGTFLEIECLHAGGDGMERTQDRLAVFVDSLAVQLERTHLSYDELLREAGQPGGCPSGMVPVTA